MKRTLLVSAFAVMALAASAQISEVTKVKGDGFDFIPKILPLQVLLLLIQLSELKIIVATKHLSLLFMMLLLTWRKLLIMTLGYSKAIWYQ